MPSFEGPSLLNVQAAARRARRKRFIDVIVAAVVVFVLLKLSHWLIQSWF